jgi:F-type H+-transporting ATPase subunit alpha
VIIYAGTNGYLDDLPVGALRRFEEELFKFLETKHPKILTDIAEKKALDDAIKGALGKALDAFKKSFVLDEKKAGAKPAAAASSKKAPPPPVDEDEEEEEDDEEYEDEDEDEEDRKG